MQRFEVGTSRADITPTRRELDQLVGGFTDSPLFPEGVEQLLWGKALATKAGDCALLLISADIALTPLWMSNAIRTELGEICGLPKDAIAVCTSQNHSAPWSHRDFHGERNPYYERLIEELVRLGRAAMSNLRPARIGAMKGYAPGLCYNSRLPITEETPLEACPDRIRHKGGCMFARHHVLGRTGGRPVDHEVGVIRIENMEGSPVAIVFNYSGHPATVIEGTRIHGDFPGFAAAEIEANCSGATALFLQGSLGNAHPRGFFTNIANARKTGVELAHEVLRVLPDIATTPQVDLGFAREHFAVTLVAYPTDRLERLLSYFGGFLEELETNPAACLIGAGPDTINLPPGYPANARRNMVTPLIKYCEDRLGARRRGEMEELTPLETDIQVFRWNDIALCLHGIEMFYQTGLEVKRLSPLRYTFPIGNTNTLVGYVPTQEEFDLGGYEVVTSPMYGNLPGMRAPENCDRIIRRFMAMLNGGATPV